MKRGVWAQIIVSAILAFCIVNLTCFKYYHVVGWFDRSCNATYSIWNPGTTIRQAVEGVGVHHVDVNGYVNPDSPLNSTDYVLVLGSSHTQGKEVAAGERYTDLLNQYLSTDHSLSVYNMGMDGHWYPMLAQGFRSAIQEFPDSAAVVLEIGETIFKQKDLEAAIDAREYDIRQTGSFIKTEMDYSTRMKIALKENVPFLTLLKNKQFANINSGLQRPFHEEKTSASQFAETAVNTQSYYDVLSRTMAMIRSEYDGRIIILYHPLVKLEKDGSMTLLYEEESYSVFRRACADHDIIFLDVGPAFEAAYQKDYTVPYGFENTSMGVGHMNRYGHEIVAAQLYPLLKEVQR